MSLLIVASTDFFGIDNSVIDFSHGPLNLAKDLDDIINSPNLPGFIRHFGLSTLNKIINKPYFYIIIEEDENDAVATQADTDTMFQTITENYIQGLRNLSFGLWLIRGNSVNINSIYVYDSGIDQGFSRTIYLLNSNDEGIYQTETFSVEELNKAVEYMRKLSNLTTRQLEERKLEGESTLSGINYIKIRTDNRIDRAFQFLNLAVTNSFLPLKISFFIAIYETLFTTDNTEVLHKVTERATLYLNGSLETKVKNFKLIKYAYDIRSKFLHGQHLPEKIKTKQQLVELSVQIADLTRGLLLKILNDDGGPFLKTDQELNEWFTFLILGKAYPNDL